MKLILIFALIRSFYNLPRIIPIILSHGIGDSCDSTNIEVFKDNLKEALKHPNLIIDIKCIGHENFFERIFNIVNLRQQSEEVCKKLNSFILTNPNFKDGFHLIGLSAGAIKDRYIIQHCNIGKVKVYVSIGAPQLGINSLFTSVIKDLDMNSEYGSFIQELNNMKHYNKAYHQRLLAIEKMILIKFENDNYIKPANSAWFGFEEAGKDYVNESKLYQKEIHSEGKEGIGIKQLYDSGKINFHMIDKAEHLDFGLDEMQLYLKLPLTGIKYRRLKRR
jgi:palmitoyl-protein thioesterase